MRVDEKDAMRVIGMLLEGMSIRAASRLSGMDTGTICDLVLVVGEKCQNFLDWNIVNVAVDEIQMDECWSFVGMKAKKAKHQADRTLGDSEKPQCLIGA